jgi:hypothetical protein
VILGEGSVESGVPIGLEVEVCGGGKVVIGGPSEGEFPAGNLETIGGDRYGRHG